MEFDFDWWSHSVTSCPPVAYCGGHELFYPKSWEDMFAMVRMNTTVDREKLLATLRSNLETHSKIVQEARDGYIAKAKESLLQRLEQLRSGKLVALIFDLSPPRDYSEQYRTAIQMLEWNSSQTIELDADAFRNLVMDKWNWNRDFLFSNSAYSSTARKMSASMDDNDV